MYIFMYAGFLGSNELAIEIKKLELHFLETLGFVWFQNASHITTFIFNHIYSVKYKLRFKL